MLSREDSAPVFHSVMERRIREACVSMRFGTVFQVVRDGRVIRQVKNEKGAIGRTWD